MLIFYLATGDLYTWGWGKCICLVFFYYSIKFRLRELKRFLYIVLYHCIVYFPRLILRIHCIFVTFEVPFGYLTSTKLPMFSFQESMDNLDIKR